jgi:Ca2+-binding RTX toxin-like protein
VVTNVEDIVLNGQQVVISGNLAGTGLAPNTIHYEGTGDNDVFDAGGLTSLESIRANGLAGNDKIIGANDDDTLEGGDGDDSLTGRGGPDSLNGGAGTDELRGGDDADTLDGGADADKLFGDAGDDQLIGGLGVDQLDGGNGKDSLNGGDGADVLIGGNGQDILFGGAGADSFRIEKGAADQILDFSHADGDKLVFVGGSGSVSLKIVDADGDGLKDDLSVSAGGGFSVELIGVTTLQVSDWIFG